MTVSTLVGYIGVGVAAIFFGSTYVPVKQHRSYDGVMFGFFQCVGVLLMAILVSFVVQPYDEKGWLFVPTGILGGALWCGRNFFVTPIVKSI